MRRTRSLVVGGLVLIILILGFSQLRLSGSQTRQDVTPTAERQSVPVKKVLVKKLPEALEGIALEDGQFKLKPGYKFLPSTNNRIIIALQTGGHGVKGSFDCFCPKQGGSCAVITVGGTLSCAKSQTSACSDECILRTTINGNRTKLAIF